MGDPVKRPSVRAFGPPAAFAGQIRRTLVCFAQYAYCFIEEIPGELASMKNSIELARAALSVIKIK